MQRLCLLLLGLPLASFAAGNDWSTALLNPRGPRTALANPALLAVEGARWSVEFPGAGMTVSNNSFSVGYWNSRIAHDSYWDRGETRMILKRIPQSGFGLQVDGTAPVLGVQVRNFALNIQALVAARASVPRAVAELALVGSRLNKNYSLTDLVGQSAAITDGALSWGRTVPQPWLPRLDAGLTLHYYQGLVYTNAAQQGSGLFATDEMIRGSGTFTSDVATRGQGMGADVGFAATVSPRWRVGLAVQQIGATLKWQLEERRVSTFNTQMDGVNLDSLDEDGYADRALVSEDTTLKGGTVTSRLPLRVQAAALFLANHYWSVAGMANVLTPSSAWGKAGGEGGVAVGYRPVELAAIAGRRAGGRSARAGVLAGDGLPCGRL